MRYHALMRLSSPAVAVALLAACTSSTDDGEAPVSAFVFVKVTGCTNDRIQGTIRNAGNQETVDVVVRWEVVRGDVRLDDGVEFARDLAPRQTAVWSSPLFDVVGGTCKAVVDSVGVA